jgi:hypothetical protein
VIIEAKIIFQRVFFVLFPITVPPFIISLPRKHLIIILVKIYKLSRLAGEGRAILDSDSLKNLWELKN